MRPIKHLTPRYIVNRFKEIYFQRKCPDAPWLTKEAVSFLKKYLLDTDCGFEWGSGRSTIWFAHRVGKLISVESNEVWYANVSSKSKTLNSLEYYLLTGDAYYKKILECQDNSFDFILVDGHYRDRCALNAINKLKAGGLLIIDNVNWYLPNDSYSPNSKRVLDKTNEEDKNWQLFLDIVQKWRYYWTSSGVTDTAFYFKPL